MNKAQQKRFDSLYRKHLSALKRQGKAESTIDVYSRVIRRLTDYFDCPPDVLKKEQLEAYFESLISTHSWSTVKVDRNGLQFFYKHVLKWLNFVKPPQEKRLPDVLTLREIERLLNGTREWRYQTFILTSFSMGLRLGEALSIQVRDIDAEQGLPITTKRLTAISVFARCCTRTPGGSITTRMSTSSCPVVPSIRPGANGVK